MNYQNEVELLIRGCHPVLTIISNKETAALQTGGGATSSRTPSFLASAHARQRNGVFRPSRRRNRAELAGRSVK